MIIELARWATYLTAVGTVVRMRYQRPNALWLWGLAAVIVLFSAEGAMTTEEFDLTYWLIAASFTALTAYVTWRR